MREQWERATELLNQMQVIEVELRDQDSLPVGTMDRVDKWRQHGELRDELLSVIYDMGRQL